MPLTNASVPASPSNFASRPATPSRLVEARYLIAFLITLVLVVVQFRYHMVGGYTRLATALGTCMAVEAAFSWFDRGKVANLQSAYISGISLTLLTKPQGAVLWPFVVGAILAIGSKYVLRDEKGHFWNPTNFAIVALLLAAPHKVSVLSHQWGNDLTTNLVIWTFGLVIATRVKVLHLTVTYVVSFLVLAWVRATLMGQSVWPEIAPLTGPMYQLFIFFMITDPRTIVRDRKWQVVVVVVIAMVEALIRVASDQGWNLPVAFNAAPPLVALFLVGPLALLIERRRTSAQLKSGGAIPRSAGSPATT
ncbi:MAG: RnfABCDGE type electron transport complex subunit D [Gemmatimonadota bacterium]